MGNEASYLDNNTGDNKNQNRINNNDRSKIISSPTPSLSARKSNKLSDNNNNNIQIVIANNKQ